MSEEEKENAPAPEPAKKASKGGGGGAITAIVLVVWLASLGGSVTLVYMATLGFIPPTVTTDDVYEEFVASRVTDKDDPAIYVLDPFSVNLTGQPQRSIRIQVSLHMLGEEGFDEIGQLDAEARDSIVRLLGSKSFVDLETIQGKLFLKQQIASNLNKRLKEGVIKNVYFNEFLIR